MSRASLASPPAAPPVLAEFDELLKMRELLLAEPDEATATVVMRRFWDICRETRDPERVGALEAAPEYAVLRAFFSVRWGVHLRRLETLASREILADASAADLSAASMLALENYRGIDGELGLLGESPARNAAVLGCGPFPETLIGLQRSALVGESLTGVDRNHEAVTLADAMRRRFCTPRPRVTIAHTDAEGADFPAFDLVVVANGLTGKARLLDRIHRTAPSGVRVLVRNPTLLARMLYDHVDPGPRSGWRVTERRATTALSETLLLERGEHA